MPERSFPFSPTSATALRLGDVIAVQHKSGDWVSMLVTDLQPGVRSHFVVGPLPWRGASRPTMVEVANRQPVEHGLTRIELFRDGNAQVLGNLPDTRHAPMSTYRAKEVGDTSKVWGWQAAINRAWTCLGQ